LRVFEYASHWPGLFVDRQRRCIRWFPDGRSLLLHDWKSFRRVDAQTGETRTLFETPNPIWMHAEVSRDGKALFYSSLLRSSQPGALGTLRLIRRDLETGEEKLSYQVQSGQAGLYGISLSPDGTRLAFMTSERVNNGPFRVLVTMPENGGAVKEVFRAQYLDGEQEPLHWWGACWSRDGRYILATRSIMTEKQSDELVAFPVDGGEPRVLAAMPGDIYDPTASLDGRHILFTSAHRSLELWV
jgi:Tol biopolymer transport system component